MSGVKRSMVRVLLEMFLNAHSLSTQKRRGTCNSREIAVAKKGTIQSISSANGQE